MSHPPLAITLGGNATVLLELGSVRLLADPWLTERIGPWRRWRPCGLTASGLGPLDALFISHAHPDHLDLPSLASLPRDLLCLTPEGTPAQKLRGAGFTQVRALQEWEAIPLGPVTITAVPSIHCRASLGLVAEAAGQRVYFAGDAGPKTRFAEIAERCGRPDVALLPVGGSTLAWGPLQRHLTPELAARAAVAMKPKVVVPIHWGHVPCVPAFLDRFRGTPEQFIRVLQRLAPSVLVRDLEEGVRAEFPGE
jgi:L-ascorbate metabolism protein UlaG (beta-lactamase superfamily)